MVIQHNLQAMNSNRQLGITTSNSAKSQEKLSSGYKINRAADDAAGLSISEKMRKQVRGLDRATDNSYDGISLVQIADGAMAEVHDMLHRVNELSIQAANGTMSESDRWDCQREIEKIKDEIDAIHDRTKFNEIPVLQGRTIVSDGVEIRPARMETVTVTEKVWRKIKVPKKEIQVSGGDLPEWFMNGVDQESLNAGVMKSTYQPGNGNTYVSTYIDLAGFDASKVSDLDGKGFYATCCAGCRARYSIKFSADSDTNSSTMSGNNRIYTVGIQGATTSEELMDRIREATKGSSQLGNPNNHYTWFEKDGTKLIIYDSSGNGVNKASETGLFGLGVATEVVTGEEEKDVLVNETHQEEVLKDAEYAKIKTLLHNNIDIHAGTDADMLNKIFIELPYISTDALNMEDINVAAPGGAEESIRRMDYTIAYVSAERSRMGAYQNRLEHTVNNLANVVENTQAAESRIRDTEIAEEMVRLSVHNILANAGQSVLAQANQSTNGVTALLQG